MTWLAENSLIIWMLGAIALTMALIVYFQTRTRGSQFGMLGVIVVTGGLLLLSWLIGTPRKSLERTLYKLAATVEANDVQGTLSYLAPTAAPELRKDVETLMPLVRIERARIMGAPEIELENSPKPIAAEIFCQGFILAVNKRDGMKGGASDKLKMKWICRDGHWLLESYESQENWQRAAGKYRPNPVPPAK